MSFNLLFWLILVELSVVGWIDFKTKKISNSWGLLNTFLSVVFHGLFQGLYPLTWNMLIFPVGFLVVGFLLYLAGVMGAGDSKFLASLYLIVPLEFHLLLLEKLVTCTILIGGILLFLRLFRERQKFQAFLFTRYWQGVKDSLKSRFSYAPVVTLAWILLGLNLWK